MAQNTAPSRARCTFRRLARSWSGASVVVGGQGSDSGKVPSPDQASTRHGRPRARDEYTSEAEAVQTDASGPVTYPPA